MSQSTIHIQPPAPPIPIQPPRFDGNDPFWIIIAISFLVKAILGRNQPKN